MWTAIAPILGKILHDPATEVYLALVLLEGVSVAALLVARIARHRRNGGGR